MTRAQRHRIYKRARRRIRKYNEGCYEALSFILNVHESYVHSSCPELIDSFSQSIYIPLDRINYCIEQTKREWRNPLGILIENLMNQIL